MKLFALNADHKGGRLIFRTAGFGALRKRGVKSPRYRIEGFAFSASPTGECQERRADERTRTAYPCSLRVCGQWLLDVAAACKFRINKRSLVPSIAHCCSKLRPG